MPKLTPETASREWVLRQLKQFAEGQREQIEAAESDIDRGTYEFRVLVLEAAAFQIRRLTKG